MKRALFVLLAAMLAAGIAFAALDASAQHTEAPAHDAANSNTSAAGRADIAFFRENRMAMEAVSAA